MCWLKALCSRAFSSARPSWRSGWWAQKTEKVKCKPVCSSLCSPWFLLFICVYVCSLCYFSLPQTLWTLPSPMKELSWHTFPASTMLSRARSRYLTLVYLVAVLPLCIGFSYVSTCARKHMRACLGVCSCTSHLTWDSFWVFCNDLTWQVPNCECFFT